MNNTHILNSKAFILFEFCVLCIVIPGIIIAFTLAPLMFAFLYGAAGYSLILLRFFKNKSFQEMWNWKAVTKQNLMIILKRFLPACLAMILFIYWYDPDRMFNLLDRAPLFTALLMILYPVFSALPQELIFCSFFFSRYKDLFGTGKTMICASALIFAYAHILYINPVAPFLSLIGGLIFAHTYQRTKSLALVTIEHGLYGNALFLIGLGYYFYSGGVIQG